MVVADFVHLHVYTGYSRGLGAPPVSRLVQHVRDIGQSALAITDRDGLYGAPAFYREAVRAGIQPIIGCTLQLAARSRFDKRYELDALSHDLVALCKDEAGWRNLTRLTTLAHTEGYYITPRIDLALLEECREGLIFLSGGSGGYLECLLREGKMEAALEHARQMRQKTEEYYLELQDHGLPWQREINRGLMEISRQTGIPLVATNSACFLAGPDHTGWRAFQTGQPELPNPESSVKTAEEMLALFSHCQEAVENTVKIADACRLELRRTLLFPGLAPQEGDLGRLRRKVIGESEETEVSRRLDRELDFIESYGLTGLMLHMGALAAQARELDIPLRGRGLLGGLAAYRLGLTDVDPIAYGVRETDCVNLTLTCSPEGKPLLRQSLESALGAEHILELCSWVQPSFLEVVRETAQAFGLAYDEIEAMTGRLGKQGNLEKLEAYCRGNHRLTMLPPMVKWRLERELQPQPHSTRLLLAEDLSGLPVFTLESQQYVQFTIEELAQLGAPTLYLEPSPLFSAVVCGAADVGVCLGEMEWDGAELEERTARGEPFHTALLEIQAEWLRQRHPISYAAALFNAGQGSKFLGLHKQLPDVKILGPDVNLSTQRYLATPDGVRFPLTVVRNVGHGLADRMIRAREEGGRFASFQDFCSRIRPETQSRALESLIRAGALDSLASRSAMVAFWSRVQGQGYPPKPEADTFRLPEVKAYPMYRLCVMEWEETGTYFSGHPLASFGSRLEYMGAIPLDAVSATASDAKVTTAGMVTRCNMHTTQKGEPMAFVTLEDRNMFLEALVFAEALKTAGPYLKAGVLVAVTGQVSRRDQRGAKLICHRVAPLTGDEEDDACAQESPSPALWIRLEGFDDGLLAQVRQTIARNPGAGRVYLHSRSSQKTMLWNRMLVEISEELVNELKEICGDGNVALRYQDAERNPNE